MVKIAVPKEEGIHFVDQTECSDKVVVLEVHGVKKRCGIVGMSKVMSKN